MASMAKISLLFASFVLISAGSDAVGPGELTRRKEIRAQLNGNVTLRCGSEKNNWTDYKWVKINGANTTERLENLAKAQSINEHRGNLEIISVTREDNGTYECTANDGKVKTITHLIVTAEKPTVVDLLAKPVMVGWTFVRWVVNNGSAPISKYYFWYHKDGESLQSYFSTVVSPEYSNYLLDTAVLDIGVTYKLGITAKNAIGDSPDYSVTVDPLEKDLDLKPQINGSTNNSITIEWELPAKDLQDYYRYEVIQSEGGKPKEPPFFFYLNTTKNSYTIESLESDTSYSFKVRLCIVNTTQCSKRSNTINGTTARSDSQSISASLHSSEINIVAVTMFTLYFLRN